MVRIEDRMPLPDELTLVGMKTELARIVEVSSGSRGTISICGFISSIGEIIARAHPAAFHHVTAFCDAWREEELGQDGCRKQRLDSLAAAVASRGSVAMSRSAAGTTVSR